jgi:uncharacterized protein with HXXEE motif
VPLQDRLRLGLITMVIILSWKSAIDGDLRFSMAQEDVLEHRERLVFLCLILAQGAHSIEEYVTRLYAVFPPARFVSSLVSHDLAVGFLFVNAALVAFGLWCWAVPVRSRWPVGRAIVWFWILLELGNGIGHLFLALSHGGYFPGVATAPLLLLFAGWLAVLQARQTGRSSVSPS